MEPVRLPPAFADLAPLAEVWALPTEEARNARRLASRFEELKALYETLQPRLEEILGYLDGFTLDEMPDEARCLFRLALAYCESAPPVELFRQPAVVDGFDPKRFTRQFIPHMNPPEV